MGIQINGNTNNINAGIGSLSIEDINELDIVGVATAANFKTGVSNLHNVGLTLSGGQIDVGSNIKLGNAGVITATRIVSTIGTFGGDTAISGSLQIADTIQHEGDVNTKIRFPANDTISFETSGSERLRITSGGAVQITGADDQDNLLVKGGSTHFAVHQDDTDGEVSLRAQDGSGSNNSKYMTFYTHPSGSAAAERLRITSDGKVGINENPGTAQFEVKSAQLGGTAGNTQEVVRLHSPDVSNTTSYRFTNYRTSNGTSHVTSELRFRRHVDVTDMGYFGLGDSYVSIGYGTAERLRINSSGHLSVGGSNVTDVNLLTLNGSGAAQNVGMVFNKTNSPAKAYGINVHNGTGDLLVYDYTLNADRIRISSAGHVTKPYHVCFGATGNQGTYSVATGQVFAFNTYHQSYPNSRHTAYNTSTSKFTAPVAGVYSFTVNLYFRNVNLSNLFSLVPRVNGSEVQGGAGDKIFFFSCQNINQDTTISGTVYLNLDAGDEVDVARRTGQAGSHSFYMPHSSFFGHLIG